MDGFLKSSRLFDPKLEALMRAGEKKSTSQSSTLHTTKSKEKASSSKDTVGTTSKRKAVAAVSCHFNRELLDKRFSGFFASEVGSAGFGGQCL